MKTRIIKLFIFGSLLLFFSVTADAQKKVTCTGNWKFEAPTAPDGYTYGIMAIKKDSVITQFTDGNYKFPSNWVKLKSDSIIFESDINGTTVVFSLKINDNKKVSGNAVWNEGETLMILTKKEN